LCLFGTTKVVPFHCSLVGKVVSSRCSILGTTPGCGGTGAVVPFHKAGSHGTVVVPWARGARTKGKTHGIPQRGRVPWLLTACGITKTARQKEEFINNEAREGEVSEKSLRAAAVPGGKGQ